MEKVIIDADIMLEIVKGIMNDDNINTVIDDDTAPDDWQGKKINEVLNIEYYTFRYRPKDTGRLIRETQQENKLTAMTRSFGIFVLGDVERLFSANIDFLQVPPSIEFWVQSNKIKLLEKIVGRMQAYLNGNSPVIQINGISRQVSIVLNDLNVLGVQENTGFGEMAVATLDMFISLQQDTTGADNWEVAFVVGQTGDEQPEPIWHEVAVTNLTVNKTMTSKGIPKADKPSNTGVLNLASTRIFSLTFEGKKKDPVIELFADRLLGEDADNNEPIIMRLTRNSVQYTYSCVTTGHTLIQQNGSDNEQHNVTLAERGING
jgi:hypothetical protein